MKKLSKFAAGSILSLIILFAVGSIYAVTPVATSLQGSAAKVKDKSEYHVDIFVDSGENNKLSGTTAVLTYPQDALIFDKEASVDASPECEERGFKLNQLLNVKDDPKTGTLTITRVLIERDENLPSGEFCFGTLAFTTQMKGFWSFLPWVTRSGTVELSAPDDWELVGPGNTYVANHDQAASSVDITVTH